MTKNRVFILGGFVLAFTGCKGAEIGGSGSNSEGTLDMSVRGNGGGDGFQQGDGGQGCPQLTACGDCDPACVAPGFDPKNKMPFPLGGDPNKDPNENDDGVSRDPDGYLSLDSAHAAFDFLWIANSGDWDKGTVSKMNSKTVKEVARYDTVTCYSLPGGSQAQCDGTNGCCTLDDFYRYDARTKNMTQPPHQGVQRTTNFPSRTAVDFNGDLYVSNRAFGGQSSVTHIANDPSECIDRNKNGKIDTSSDANGDGVIQTDCNANNIQDDLTDIKATPCLNGAGQEFFGVDDECILWTTNTNINDQWGRPLGLGPGAVDIGPSDAWAGSFNDGKFFRIDGTTGMTKQDTKLPDGCHPYGVAIDAEGYAWSPPLNDGQVCYFNTKKLSETAIVRNPTWGTPIVGYGISLDRDQNIWVGGQGTADTYRYTPNRTNAFASLGNGYWVKIANIGKNGGVDGPNYGVAADSRIPLTQYWVWTAIGTGYIVRLPGSDLEKQPGFVPMKDSIIDGSAFPVVQVAGVDVRGVGVDRDQNIWAISNSNSVTTRIHVDTNGNMTKPDITSPPAGNTLCPGGDRCVLKDRNAETNPYTYSDFTGFGLRNFTRPKGSYSYIYPGCSQQTTPDTQWYNINWEGDVPANTSITVHARTGRTPKPDQTWGPWTMNFVASPADLRKGMPLMPFDKDDYFLQVEFILSTMDRTATPRLKSFNVSFKCGIPG